jgi:predicted dehydrogenase
MAKKRCLMIGAGGFAWGCWIQKVLPLFSDRIEVTGLVDINAQALSRAAEFLHLPANRCFQDIPQAFDRTEADFCCVVIPPAVHADAVVAAADRGVAVLSEKPIADTPEAVNRIYRAVKQAGVKMAVIQNYRYTDRMWTVRHVLRSGQLGRVNYVVARFAADYRKPGAWGAFRHEIADSLVVEGAVHHFDMIRNLCAANCVTISGAGWNPPWSSFKGNCVGLYVMEMENDACAIYEGNCCGAGKQNSWHKEYYRAECERGAIEIDADQTVRIIRVEQAPEPVPMVRPEPEGHAHIVKAFLNWLDGGPAPETHLDDNIHSAATMFAAIQAGNTGRTVRVADFLPDR